MLFFRSYKPTFYNKIAAVTTIFAGIFAVMAALIPIAAPIAAPISLTFALISGCSWLRAAMLETQENKLLDERPAHSNNDAFKTKGMSKGAEISPSKTSYYPSLSYHTHHTQNVIEERNKERKIVTIDR